MLKLILGFIGQAGCGKGTATEIMGEKYHASSFRFSAILNDILARLHLDPSRDHFVRLSETLRKTFGEEVLSHAIAKDALEATTDLVTIDGIRRLEDLHALAPLPHFKLIAIDVPAEIRFERLKQRGEKTGESTMSWEKFLSEEQRSTEITIPETMKCAAFTISNAGTREDLEREIDAVIKKLGWT